MQEMVNITPRKLFFGLGVEQKDSSFFKYFYQQGMDLV